jgi:lipoprotein signal peptidase
VSAVEFHFVFESGFAFGFRSKSAFVFLLDPVLVLAFALTTR